MEWEDGARIFMFLTEFILQIVIAYWFDASALDIWEAYYLWLGISSINSDHDITSAIGRYEMLRIPRRHGRGANQRASLLPLCQRLSDYS